MAIAYKKDRKYESAEEAEKVARVGVRKAPGFRYLVDSQGDISRKGSNGNIEKVAKVGVRKSEGYVYFVDDRGDISRKASKAGSYENHKEKAVDSKITISIPKTDSSEPKDNTAKTLLVIGIILLFTGIGAILGIIFLIIAAVKWNSKR